MSTNASHVQACWDALADVKQELAERDWFPGTSGNLSIRVTEEPLTFLVTASGVDKRKRTKDDFVLVNENGIPVTQNHLRPSAETGIHAAIYKKTNAGCCLHVHTVDNNLISDWYASEGKVVFRGVELIKAFGIWDEDGQLVIPIVENLANLEELAKEIERVIDSNTRAVLIRNHGITVWGKNSFEAKKHLEACEFLFSYQVKHLLFKAVSLEKSKASI